MKNLAKPFTNLTIKDFAMLALSVFLLIIIGLATCNHHDHQDYVHYGEHGNKYNDVEKSMDEFWDQTKDRNTQDKTFGEPMDELVGALTGADEEQEIESAPSDDAIETEQAIQPVDDEDIELMKEAEETISNIDDTIVEAIQPDVEMDEEEIAELNASMEELIASIQEEENQIDSRDAIAVKNENTTPKETDIADKLISVIKGDKSKSIPDEEIIDQALLEDLEHPAMASTDEVINDNNKKLEDCLGKDASSKPTKEWRELIKVKIKTLLLNDDPSGCVDILLEAL